MALVKSYLGRVQVGKKPNLYMIESDGYVEVPNEIAFTLDETVFDIVYNDTVWDSKASTIPYQNAVKEFLSKNKKTDRKVKGNNITKPQEKKITEEEAYDMTKSEQVEYLKKKGLSEKIIEKLKYEKDRVKAILDFQ